MSSVGPSRGRLIELREHPRIQIPPTLSFSCSRVEVPASFTRDIEGEGTVVNLSMKGCQVLSAITVEPGDHLSLNLQVPRQRSPLIVELTTVRWVHGQSFGLEFISLWPAEEERLRQFLSSIAEKAK